MVVGIISLLLLSAALSAPSADANAMEDDTYGKAFGDVVGREAPSPEGMMKRAFAAKPARAPALTMMMAQEGGQLHTRIR